MCSTSTSSNTLPISSFSALAGTAGSPYSSAADSCSRSHLLQMYLLQTAHVPHIRCRQTLHTCSSWKEKRKLVKSFQILLMIVKLGFHLRLKLPWSLAEVVSHKRALNNNIETSQKYLPVNAWFFIWHVCLITCKKFAPLQYEACFLLRALRLLKSQSERAKP